MVFRLYYGVFLVVFVRGAFLGGVLVGVWTVIIVGSESVGMRRGLVAIGFGEFSEGVVVKRVLREECFIGYEVAGYCG